MENKLEQNFKNFFGCAPEVMAKAPGRIEFIGNHTDYNGGYVMGAAIDKFVMCAVSKRDDKKIQFASALSGEKVLADISDIKKFPRQQNWANYPLGIFKFLLEAGLTAEVGFNFTDVSSLPSGAGLSSSAAIEMSACAALAKLYDFKVDKKTMVKIGRKSENNFVGMPCGILDQGVSVFGKKDSIVFIDCLEEEFENYPLPRGCRFFLFNTTKKHELVDGLYAARHKECMEASDALSEIGEERLLRAFTLDDLESKKTMMSANAYKRAKHVIEENARVLKARELLIKGDMQGLGKLLFESHESSRTLFENSCPELDFFVDCLRAEPNVYGARLSGGGFGGAVMALVNSEFTEAQAQKLADLYELKFGAKPRILECTTSDGAQTL